MVGFYRICVIDAILEHAPADYVRRPTVPAESPALGLGHLQFEALITTARKSSNPNDFALSDSRAAGRAVPAYSSGRNPIVSLRQLLSGSEQNVVRQVTVHDLRTPQRLQSALQPSHHCGELRPEPDVPLAPDRLVRPCPPVLMAQIGRYGTSPRTAEHGN